MSIISPERALLGCVSSSAEYQQRSNIYNLVTLLKCCSFDHFLYWMKKKASPYATEEYLFMPTITAHPRTDCLNRSANNWRISKLFNTFMTQYNIFDPQQLCQGRGGLNCQVWKVIVEHSQSVSQCFTAAQSY